ncbi:MAG TPA: protein-disulfide reductase DsbD [Arcobacter sp.]|nr:protein-disulfide reductase DsbD [Arcobacter sp.]
MKYILVLLLLLSSTFANDNDFLPPSEAFKVNLYEKKDSININIDIDDTIYLYHDKIKVYIDKKKVTKEVFDRKPVEYHEFIVHFGDFEIEVPKELIKKTIGENSEYTIKVKYQGCSKKGLCYAPMKNTYTGSFGGTSSKADVAVEEEVDETTTIANVLTNGNIFLILITFFGFGLLLSLTPCIFPMIPILSSIIVQHTNKNDGKMSASQGFMLSLVYVLAMSVAYTIAGILAGLFGANIQAMLQNPYVLVTFAGVFVALAFSLFGYYSLELPQSFTNKVNKFTGDNDNHGMAGVALMGFLSALIVGPCVAPPLAGALVYIGQTGDAVLGGLALFVMSLGLGAPLLLVGAGAGKYMPKPGGWMETVSKVFGVIMIALAIYMLDRLLDQWIIWVLYALLSLGSAVYLLKNSNTFGKIVAVVLIVLAGYFAYLSTNTVKEYVHFEYVKTSAELDSAIKNSSKPVMLDFWASWCVSCKELEHITYADPRVQEFLAGYTLLKVDVTENTDADKALMKRFNVFGPPALIFWDKDGKEEESKKIVGYKNPKDFLDIVTK